MGDNRKQQPEKRTPRSGGRFEITNTENGGDNERERGFSAGVSLAFGGRRFSGWFHRNCARLAGAGGDQLPLYLPRRIPGRKQRIFRKPSYRDRSFGSDRCRTGNRDPSRNPWAF